MKISLLDFPKKYRFFVLLLLLSFQVSSAGECFSVRCKAALKDCVTRCFAGKSLIDGEVKSCVNLCIEQNED